MVLVVATLLGAQFSGRQPATVALDIGLSVIRLGLPLLIILLMQELFTREFDRRYYLTSLTAPQPRSHFLLGRFSALIILTFGAIIILGIILAALVGYLSYYGYQQSTPVDLGLGYVVTLVFTAIDLFVIATLALLISIVAVTPSFVLIGTLGFLLVSRSYSGIIALLENERYVVDNPELYRGSLGILYYLLPDLGALDVRRISLYSKWEFLPADWPGLVLSTLAYALALLALSIWLLGRKQFN
ncbi:hypothetical protein [Thiohalophilus sp.]|nr:hypothetical protein [Thiohalophilus sp.]